MLLRSREHRPRYHNLLGQVTGFDWDEANVTKNRDRHHVTHIECEEAFFNEPLVVASDDNHSREEQRFIALGRTDAGRLIFVAFTVRAQKLRVLSLKKIPGFSSEDEEREFWATHDSTEYVDYSKAKRVSFPNLKPSVKTISLRLPESLLEHLKMLANKRDVPYQSLLKIYLAEKIEEELKQVG